MAWTQSDYDALKKAIASGAREVWYGDKRVAYRSLDEMKQILADIEQELGNGQRKSRFVRTSHSKGF